MTNENMDLGKILELRTKEFERLLPDYVKREDPNRALYLKDTEDSDRLGVAFLMVRMIWSFGDYKICVKEVSLRGEGGGAYFDKTDLSGATEYVKRQMERIYAPLPFGTQTLKDRFAGKRSETCWSVHAYDGISWGTPPCDNDPNFSDAETIDLL